MFSSSYARIGRPGIPIAKSGFRYCNSRIDPGEKTRADDREVDNLGYSLIYWVPIPRQSQYQVLFVPDFPHRFRKLPHSESSIFPIRWATSSTQRSRVIQRRAYCLLEEDYLRLIVLTSMRPEIWNGHKPPIRLRDEPKEIRMIIRKIPIRNLSVGEIHAHGNSRIR